MWGAPRGSWLSRDSEKATSQPNWVEHWIPQLDSMLHLRASHPHPATKQAVHKVGEESPGGGREGSGATWREGRFGLGTHCGCANPSLGRGCPNPGTGLSEQGLRAGVSVLTSPLARTFLGSEQCGPLYLVALILAQGKNWREVPSPPGGIVNHTLIPGHNLPPLLNWDNNRTYQRG